MKRIIIIISVMVLLFSGCNLNNSPNQDTNAELKGKTSIGVWLSYTELNNMLTSQNNFVNEITTVAENCKKLSVEDIYIHVRSNCDSIFKSQYFPFTDASKNFEFDIFEYMIELFHSKGIKVHAWINPYRVKSGTVDTTLLDVQSPVYKWLNDEISENDKNVCYWEGIYLNPAEAEVRELVLNGIRELICNYNIDGIHFDDYFYPATDPVFDEQSYNEYKKSAKNPLELDEWRRFNVTTLISACQNIIEFYNKDLLFSISPCASIDNNYNLLYADIEHWVKNGYVDRIIPQLYFGFEYPLEDFRFESLLKEWKKLVECNKSVELIIGLAGYKIGIDSYPDCNEWQNEKDILKRQAEICFYDQRISGFSLFSYSSIFSNEELNTLQRENLLEFLKTVT